MDTQRRRTESVQQVDFLPVHLHEEYARRRSQAWRILVVCAFAAALPTASLYQYRMRLAVDRQLAEIDNYYKESIADQQRLEQLTSMMAVETATAQLAVYLQHSWPQTQILAAVVEPLPAAMSLEEIVVRRQQAPRAGLQREEDAGKRKAVSLLPAAEDLETLRQQEQGTLVVQLNGLTTSNRQLHSYLSRLGQHPLFIRVDLGSIEREPVPEGGQSVARFEALLYVRPRHSSLDSPEIEQQTVQAARPVRRGNRS